MNIEPAAPTTKNPAAQFHGDVWLDMIALPHEASQHMTVATVRFAPGARTAWHSHEKGQYLRVTQGIGRFGSRDGTTIDVHPGQTIYTRPANSTGTPPPPASSWNTSPCSKTVTTRPPPRPGSNTSPTASSTPPEQTQSHHRAQQGRSAESPAFRPRTSSKDTNASVLQRVVSTRPLTGPGERSATGERSVIGSGHGRPSVCPMSGWAFAQRLVPLARVAGRRTTS